MVGERKVKAVGGRVDTWHESRGAVNSVGMMAGSVNGWLGVTTLCEAVDHLV